MPEINSTLCPGQMVVFTCLSTEGSIAWRVGDELYVFNAEDNVNDTKMGPDFVAKLIARNGSSYTSTLTNPMVSSAHDGLVIRCVGDTGLDDNRTIDVAGIYKIIIYDVQVLCT